MTDRQILVAGAVLALAFGAAVATRRLQFPSLAAFLGLGMVLGSEGLGGIEFDDAALARSIGVIGLIAILFEGGLQTRWGDLRPVLAPALVLSTLGVVVTAAITAAFARLVLPLDTKESFLLGAVVGSTDAAAVFATLRWTRLRRRLANLLAGESGLNDPTAVALTVGLVDWIEHVHDGLGELVLLLVRQLAIGFAVGLVLGVLASRLAARLPGDLAAFAPVASVAAAALAYGAAAVADGSGFLAVYVVALFVGNARGPFRDAILPFHEGLAFIAQVVLFVVLGLLVFPSRLGPVAWSGLALTAVLIFVARPGAVVLSLLPFRYTAREQAFVAWAGLRGAVPIVLATIARSAGVPGSETIFDVVFFVVLASTVVQGLTLEPVARRLGLAQEP